MEGTGIPLVKPDNDDEIVKEIPICHATRLQDNLFCFRYQLLPTEFGHDMKITKGFYKPNNQELELEMGINVETSNFDSDRAELIAQEVDGPPENRKKQSVYFENDLVDKVSLKSKKVLKDPTKYAALIYNGKEIHLTTVKEIFQFRPSFPYLDMANKKRKDADEFSEDEEAGPSTAQPITVKFKQGDDRWKKSKTSFKSLEAKSAEEAWIPYEYHNELSSRSNVEKLKLFAENVENTRQASNLTDKEYLRVLVPEDQEQATIEPTLPSHIIGLSALRALPLEEQCRLLLKDAKIIKFQQLFMILAGGEGLTADALLKALPKVAILVRGNWVVKSEILYPNNSFSATSGVPAEIMCRARNYVLYLFTKNQYVERKKVSSVMKIPSEEVKEIFMGFSRLSHNKGWELVLPIDHDFVVKHNEIVHKQYEAWEQRFQQISEFLKETKRHRRKSKSVSECSNDGKVKNTYVSSDNDSGTEKKSPIGSRRNPKVKKESNALDSS